MNLREYQLIVTVAYVIGAVVLFALLAVIVSRRVRRPRPASRPDGHAAASRQLDPDDEDEDVQRPARRVFRGVGAGAIGSVYELLNEDKRRAVEIIVEQRAEVTDPETKDGNLPDLASPHDPKAPSRTGRPDSKLSQ